jgi:AhpC/TSA family
LLQTDGEVSAAYRAHGTPTAVVIGPDGVVMSPTVAGTVAIRRLVEQATSPALALWQGPYFDGHNGTSVPPPAPPTGISRVGEPAPELVLADLDGRPIALKDLYHRTTLAIFWDPACGFCQRMLADLKALEDALPTGAPQLVVFSSGDPDRVRLQHIRSLVLLDPERQAMRAFGAGGTPMAVLVDERGRIASAVLGGAAAVLARARADPVPAGG